MDLIIRLPIPGQEKTCSVTTAPPISSGISIPRYVTTGIKEFRSTCFIITFFSLIPFDRAVLTKSSLITSSMLLLVYWIRLPTSCIARTTDGINKWHNNEPMVSFFPTSYMPPIGRTFNFTEKTYKKINARKKLGVEVARNENTDEPLSQPLF